MKKLIPLLILTYMLTFATAQGELLFTVEQSDADILIQISGSADISGLTAQTRSGTAFLGESGLLSGNLPDLTDDLANLQRYDAYTLDLYPSAPLTTAPTPELLGNWFRDPTLTSMLDTNATVGFYFGDDFDTSDPNDTFGELYLPTNYISGSEISATLTLTDRTLADFGWEIGDTSTLGWAAEQDTLVFTVIPEPATTGLLFLSAGSLLGFRRLKRKTRFWETDTAPSKSENIL